MKQNIRKSIRTLTSVLISTTLIVSLSGCNSLIPRSGTTNPSLTQGFNPEPANEKEPDEVFLTATADFSIQLFQQSLLAEEQLGKQDNLLVSPESALVALAMTANGAGSTTKLEMEQVLGGGMSIEDLNSYIHTYNQKLVTSEDVTFHIANSIWFRNDPNVQIQDKFLQTDRTYYNANAYMAPFDQSTVDDINQWVKTNTNGMIDTLLKEIPPEAWMYLINALAFEGKWDTPYEDKQINEEGEFTNKYGIVETVPMLSSTEGRYLQGEHATGFIKYYEGREFAFLALLPEEGMTVEEYAATLTGEEYMKMYQNREYKDVYVRIPEFTYDYSTDLAIPLQEMGMGEAFTPAADFSNMSDASLMIDSVIHKTYIQVDRSGTKAAAVTAVAMKENAAPIMEEPVYVYLDRPFVYAIIDTETGLPVFMGTVNTIQAQD